MLAQSEEDDNVYNVRPDQKLVILPIVKENSLREKLAMHQVDPDWLLYHLEKSVESSREFNEITKVTKPRTDYLKERVGTNMAALLRIALRASKDDQDSIRKLSAENGYLSIELIRDLEKELETVRQELKQLRESFSK